MADRRIAFAFSSNALERLEQLKRDMAVGTYAEVIRQCPCYAVWIIDEQKKGNEVGAIKDGKILNTVRFLS